MKYIFFTILSLTLFCCNIKTEVNQKDNSTREVVKINNLTDETKPNLESSSFEKPIEKSKEILDSTTIIEKIKECQCLINTVVGIENDNFKLYNSPEGEIIKEFDSKIINELLMGFVNITIDSSYNKWFRIKISPYSLQELNDTNNIHYWIKSNNVYTGTNERKDIYFLYDEPNINSNVSDTLNGYYHDFNPSNCFDKWFYIETDSIKGWLSPKDQNNNPFTSA